MTQSSSTKYRNNGYILSFTYLDNRLSIINTRLHVTSTETDKLIDICVQNYNFCKYMLHHEDAWTTKKHRNQYIHNMPTSIEKKKIVL